MQIGIVGKRVGLSVDTIRFYERNALLPLPPRTQGGFRLVALFFAGRKIFRPVRACQAGEVCAVPETRRLYKIVFGIVSALVLIALAFPYVAKFFY